MTTTHHPQSARTWIKSSYSEGSGNACVEVAREPHAVAVRDSKDTRLPGLTLSPTAWSAFVSTLD